MCNLYEEELGGFLNVPMTEGSNKKQARKPRSYASPKLCPACD